jgi:phosphopantetheine--protein transferase-like protein
MWSFETSRSVLACGIDAEKISRFTKLIQNSHNPMPLVFTDKEVAHTRTLDNQAAALGAAFCCKEAVLKAIGQPYNLTDCELYIDFEKERQYVLLADELRKTHGIVESFALVDHDPMENEELSVIVLLLGE